MGILDKLFGSDDPIEKELDKSNDNENTGENKGAASLDGDGKARGIDMNSSSWPPHNVLYGEDKWPYKIEPVKNEMLSGREIYVEDDDGNLYMGKDIRDRIENRKYDKEGATRLGFTKDNVKGVQDVYIDHNALFRHIALFGQTGYGKSTLMRNIMLQWINAGYGICYIDPKGDDSPELMQQIPPHRKEDVVWVEPGANREKQVGFNVFDTASDPGDPRYEREIDSLSNDFVDILKAKSDNWGPQIGNITQTLVQALIRAEDPFNPIDLVKIITDEEERKLLAENYGDEIEKVFIRRVAEQSESAFEPILRRINSWVKNRKTRQIMAHAESKINIAEAVRDGKILIVNTASVESDQTKEIVTRIVISRVWSTIRIRNEEEPEPYFLCVDEFDKVINDSFDINKIVSQARSFKLSVFVANQQPSQLPDDVKQAMQQVQSLITFHPGNNHRDQGEIAKVLGDVDSWELTELEKYHIVGKPYMNGENQDAIVVKTYGEYPPLRTTEEAQELIDGSLEKYGTTPEVNTNMDEYGVDRFLDEDDTGFEINPLGDTIDKSQVLESIYSAQLRQDTKEIDGDDDWVTLEQIMDEVEKYATGVEDAHASKMSSILEGFTSREIQQTVSDAAYFRLGNEGLKKAFEPDTGTAASGGKSPHRILLREGHKAFTKLGYDVTLPSQNESGSLPDGVASPPIKPMEESDTFDEAVEKEVELVEQNPRLAQLFGDNEISIEAESTTITRPAQTIKNLVKAVKNNKHCVFLVKDGGAKRDCFEYWARAGENILTSPPFVRSMDEYGNRTFYTTNKKVKLSNNGTALVPKDAGQASWSEYGKENGDNGNGMHIMLESSNSNQPLAKFEEASKLGRNPTPSQFPYHYIRDTTTSKTIVQDSDGNVVEKYENLGELRKDGQYKTVSLPIIPDYEMPGGEYPDQDDWTFVIIPESNKRGPVIYEDGNMAPLLPEDGAKIDPDGFNDMQVELNIESVIPTSQIKDDTEDIIVEPDSDDFAEADDTEDGQKIDITEKQTSATDPFDEFEDEVDNESPEDGEDEKDSTDSESIPDKHSFPNPPSENFDN